MIENKENFKVVCELFCYLAHELEKNGNEDFAEDVDDLMRRWLEETLYKRPGETLEK